MRVNGEAVPAVTTMGAPRAEGEVRAGRFGETLRRARAGSAEAPGERTAIEHPAPGPLAALPEPVLAEIAAVVRALPVAIAVARSPGDLPLALSFGRSLDVELRTGPAGIELVLRPEPRLLSAATAELPRIVGALRTRGIPVARAEVRSRGDRRRRRAR